MSYRILKISGIIISALIILLALLVFAVHFIFRDQLVQYAVDQLNRQVDSKITIRKGELSFLKSFPNVAVEFSDMYAQSANTFQKLNGLSHDTLLIASNVRFEFNLFKLLNKEFVLKKIHVSDGRIYLRVTPNGALNYDVFKASGTPDPNASDIQLKNVTLNNCYVQFIHEGSDVAINTFCDRLVLRGTINPLHSNFQINSNMLVHKLSVQSSVYMTNRSLKANMHLEISDKINYSFKETEFKLDDLNFLFQGFYSAGQVPFINFEFKGNKLNLTQVFDYLPSDIKSDLTDYTAKGALNTTVVIKGDISTSVSPQVNIQFDIEKGAIAEKKSGIKLYDITLGGSFTNGKKKSIKSSVLLVEKFFSKFGSGDVALTGKIFGLNQATVEVNGVAKLNLNELKDFFKLDTFELFQGNAEGSLSIRGSIEYISDFKFNDFKKFNYSGQVNLRNTNFKFRKSIYSIKDLNGDLFISNDIDFRNISFNANENGFTLNGRLVNGLRYVFNQSPNTTLEAEISSNYLELSKFFDKGNKKETGPYSRELLFPDNFGLDVKLNISEFKLGKFTAKWIKGNLQYKPRMFVLKSISLECLEGRIQGNGAIIQDMNKNFIVRGQADISKINIQKTFFTFNNFTQTVISDKNLRGKLSGKVNFSSEWNKSLAFNYDKLLMDANFTITNGELVNFEPLYGLSRFISLEELKNIKFSTLKNTIYIKDRQIIIPTMDINSTAFNISGSGTHSFDNHYKYKIKVLLSEILYGKAKKAKKANEEYGIVEDDGLGKTSLHLSIEGFGNDYKISYDSRSTLEVVKESFVKQGKELKSIFHEEFGWFKKDTLLTKKQSENTNNVKVQWDDEETQVLENNTPTTKKSQKSTNTENKVKVEWE